MPAIGCSLRLPAPADVEQRIRGLLDAGAEGVVLEGPFFESQATSAFGMLGRDRVWASRLFLPYPTTLRAGANCPWTLGDPSVEGRRDALAQGLASLDFAARHEIPRVLVPASPLPLALPDEGAGEGSGELEEAERRAILAAREEALQRPLSVYLGTLSKLLDRADALDVRLALALGRGAGWLPNPAELLLCLEEFRGAPLEFWPDAHAVRGIQSLWPTAPSDLPRLGEPAEEDPEPEGTAAKVPILPTAAGVSVRSTTDLDDGVFPLARSLLEGAGFWVWDAAENAGLESCEQGLSSLRDVARGPSDEWTL